MNEYDKLYGFTIKDTHTKADSLSEKTYDEVIRLLNLRGNVDCIVYERYRKDGLPARLHVHGIIRFTRIPRLTSILPKGYSFLFEKIYDLKTWSKYISKRSPTFGDIDRQFFKDNPIMD